MPLRAFAPDGKEVELAIAVTPLFVRLEPMILQIVGTGFFVTRYGLMLTAKHVVDDITQAAEDGLSVSTWLWKRDGTLQLRPVLTCAYFTDAPRDAPDIAICQTAHRANDGTIHFPEPNERIAIVTSLPSSGTHIATYAYPENKRIDFSGAQRQGSIFADAFEGQFLSMVGPRDRLLRYSHVETSIDIRQGASGGPVLSGGHAFAVNCRGWDVEADKPPLSSVVPISLVLDLRFPFPHLPRGSAEEKTVPPDRRGDQVSLRDLAAWGHISLDPQE